MKCFNNKSMLILFLVYATLGAGVPEVDEEALYRRRSVSSALDHFFCSKKREVEFTYNDVLSQQERSFCFKEGDMTHKMAGSAAFSDEVSTYDFVRQCALQGLSQRHHQEARYRQRPFQSASLEALLVNVENFLQSVVQNRCSDRREEAMALWHCKVFWLSAEKKRVWRFVRKDADFAPFAVRITIGQSSLEGCIVSQPGRDYKRPHLGSCKDNVWTALEENQARLVQQEGDAGIAKKHGDNWTFVRSIFKF